MRVALLWPQQSGYLLLDVDFGEALKHLCALKWVCNLGLFNMDFKMDTKMVVYSINGGRISISDFSSIINDCRHLLSYDLATSNVRFIHIRAGNESNQLEYNSEFESTINSLNLVHEPNKLNLS